MTQWHRSDDTPDMTCQDGTSRHLVDDGSEAPRRSLGADSEIVGASLPSETAWGIKHAATDHSASRRSGRVWIWRIAGGNAGHVSFRE
jgi:hypothetical protein